MNDKDMKQFTEMLSSTLDLYGRKLSTGAYSIWFEALKPYPFQTVRDSLSTYISGGKSQAPVPADIIGMIQADDGHPPPDEAWALVAKCLTDETVTVVWTQQIASAFGIALGLSDDPIAARMAFLGAYRARLAEARKEGDPAKWMPSMGSAVAGREGPLLEAQRLGRLPAPMVQGLLSNKAMSPLLSEFLDNL